MACGTPVVTSNISSLPEVAGEAALLVNPYDPQSICNGMVELIQNENLYINLINKGFERVKNYSWENTASGFLDIYRKIAEK